MLVTNSVPSRGTILLGHVMKGTTMTGMGGRGGGRDGGVSVRFWRPGLRLGFFWGEGSVSVLLWCIVRLEYGSSLADDGTDRAGAPASVFVSFELSGGSE